MTFNSSEFWGAISKMWIAAALLMLAGQDALAAAGFAHPGLVQTREDLEFMRKKVLTGEEPWAVAWSNLCAESYSSLKFEPKPVAHVVRGPYGRPSIGDRALIDSANAAYSQALQWVVTGDRAHAERSIAILNAWSGSLWDFEDNDAKLLAGWTGHTFCNAAEILRSSDSGWKKADMEQFKRMLLTVYYPLLNDYFPEANGNWDAAMIDTILCIGVFCDDREIFNSAVDHFLRGPGNGGITKYIYPDGQCEESTRDQSHTQLGLGELAQACQVAWNQGVDLYGAADNRLALGFEYTSRYMAGEEVPAYGVLSAQSRGRFSDIYEPIYEHYHFVKGLGMPWTEKVVATVRLEKSWSALIFCRGLSTKRATVTAPLAGESVAAAGALERSTFVPPATAIRVGPNGDIQAAIDACTNGGWVVLSKGTYLLPAPLRISSGVTLSGQGLESVLILDPKLTIDRAGATIVNSAADLHDVTLCDFVVDGASIPAVSTNNGPNYDYISGTGGGAVTLRPLRRDPNQDRRQRVSPLAPSRAGIVFNAQQGTEMRRLKFERITVDHCTHDGVAIRGANGIQVVDCDLSDNGGSVVPGPGLQHNLLLSHVTGCSIAGSRLDDSPCGSGLALAFGTNVTISGNELARNARCGIFVTDSKDIRINGNLAEGNDRVGIAATALVGVCRDFNISGNVSRNNGFEGIKADHVADLRLAGNDLRDNGSASK